MNYGTVMSYEYEDEIELNNGETKVVKKKLELVFNAMTLIKYMNYTGRDFLDDFLKLQSKTFNASKTINPDLLNKAANGEDIYYDDISESDMEALSSLETIDYTFFINLIASMIATRKYPEQLDFVECINEIPLYLLYDKDFLIKLMEFIVFGLKKNKQIFSKLQAKK